MQGSEFNKIVERMKSALCRAIDEKRDQIAAEWDRAERQADGPVAFRVTYSQRLVRAKGKTGAQTKLSFGVKHTYKDDEVFNTQPDMIDMAAEK